MFTGIIEEIGKIKNIDNSEDFVRMSVIADEVLEDAKIGDSRNNFSLIGHYTQMVWSSTTQVGIAYSKSKSGKVYVVARYHPAGNYWGQYPFKP